MRRDTIFNTRRPRLLRTRVPRAENLSVIAILFAMLGLVAWVMGTRDNFDPDERDLPIELLYNDAPEIQIYNRPLQAWVDPALPVTAAAFDPAPFPPAVLGAGWQPLGRVKTYQTDNLYQKINGEAEKFIKQGFVELAYLVLRAGQDGSELALELFDQGDLGGSLGVFAEHAAGRAVAERAGVSYFLTGAGVIGRTGQFFFRVAGDRQSAEIEAKSAQLVEAFAALERGPASAEADAPAEFRLLRDALGIPQTGIQFQESNVFQYDFASRFWFGNAGLGEDARVFVHIAADPATAEALYQALLQEQAYDYEGAGEAPGYALFRHRYLDTWFALARNGRHVYGAESLPDPAAAGPLLERLHAGIGDG